MKIISDTGPIIGLAKNKNLLAQKEVFYDTATDKDKRC